MVLLDQTQTSALGSGPFNPVESATAAWFSSLNEGGLDEQSVLAELISNEAAPALFSEEP